MPFIRPTLAELRAQVAGEIATRLGLSGLLPRSILLAIAEADAAGLHFLHSHLEHLAREQYPQTAGSEGLVRWAQIAGVSRKAATFATGKATFTGTAGSSIPNATQLRRADGAVYKTRGAAVIGGGGSALVSLLALASGEIGNTSAGTVLTLSSSLPGVAGNATVDSAGLFGGLDAESDEDLRGRVLAALAAPVMGGSISDYVAWALEVPGVTRAWCFPMPVGPGSVGVAFVMDDASYGPIPSAPDVEAVRVHLETHRPAGVPQLYVFGPTASPVDFEVQLLPDTAEIQADVEASLRDLLLREAEPGGTLLLSHVQEAISLAAGEVDHVLIAPTANLVLGDGFLATFGSVTFV